MTGLRQWSRDAELPARAGQQGLCAPTREQMTRLIEGHLLLPERPCIRSTDWEYARWKPGVSITLRAAPVGLSRLSCWYPSKLKVRASPS